MTLPILPASITVDVNGTPCTILGRPNKAQTRVWYSGSIVIAEKVDDPTPILTALTTSYAGETLKKGEVHPSQPRMYAATSPNAGKVIPGTGGNMTVTHSTVLELSEVGKADTTHRFTLMVTVTYVAKKGFVVSVKAIPQAEREATLVVEGLSFTTKAA